MLTLWALLASVRMVPPFTLFEFVAPQSSNVHRANNVKGGTGVAEAGKRSQWEGGTFPAEAGHAKQLC